MKGVEIGCTWVAWSSRQQEEERDQHLYLIAYLIAMNTWQVSYLQPNWTLVGFIQLWLDMYHRSELNYWHWLINEGTCIWLHMLIISFLAWVCFCS